MTLQQLQYFCEAAKYLSFSRASETLHVSQPAISSSIKALESELGMALFERYRKEIRLTVGGLYLYNNSVDIFARVEQLAFDMRDIRLNVQVLRTGVSAALAPAAFSGLMTGFLSAHPELNTASVNFDSQKLLVMLTDGKADAVIVTENDSVPAGCESLTLTKLPVVACVSPEHPFARQERVAFSDAANSRYLFLACRLAGELRLNLIYEELLRRRVSEVRGTFMLSEVRNAAELILHNGMVGVTHKGLSRLYPEVVELPFDPPLYDSIQLVYSKSRMDYPGMREFIDYATDFAARL